MISLLAFCLKKKRENKVLFHAPYLQVHRCLHVCGTEGDIVKGAFQGGFQLNVWGCVFCLCVCVFCPLLQGCLLLVCDFKNTQARPGCRVHGTSPDWQPQEFIKRSCLRGIIRLFSCRVWHLLQLAVPSSP